MAEFVSIFCSGTFFGAALYISMAQHPATLEAGIPFAGRFFPPMYRRASVLQIGLAVAGTLGSLLAWWQGAGLVWLGSSLLLFSVIPFTLFVIMPVNHQLLAPGRSPDAPDTEALLRRWGPLHAARTVLSGLAFLLVLADLTFR
jgi:hypothetical protein